MCAAFIVCVACATAAARTLFAMGREGVLPAAFGKTHPTFKTPVNATVAVTVLAILMALLMGYPLSDTNFGQPLSNVAELEPTGPRRDPGCRCDRFRRSPLRIDPPSPAWHPQVDSASGGRLACHRHRRTAVAAHEAARSGRPDRLHPRRGRWHRRRSPRRISIANSEAVTQTIWQLPQPRGWRLSENRRRAELGFRFARLPPEA